MGLNVKRLETIALRELALLLQNDTKNRNLKYIIITEVRITNDLAFMTIYYSCFTEAEKKRAVEDLATAKGYLRSELAKKLQARKMPELVFKYDEALAYGNKINRIIQSLDIKKDNENE